MSRGPPHYSYLPPQPPQPPHEPRGNTRDNNHAPNPPREYPPRAHYYNGMPPAPAAYPPADPPAHHAWHNAYAPPPPSQYEMPYSRYSGPIPTPPTAPSSAPPPFVHQQQQQQPPQQSLSHQHHPPSPQPQMPPQPPQGVGGYAAYREQFSPSHTAHNSSHQYFPPQQPGPGAAAAAAVPAPGSAHPPSQRGDGDDLGARPGGGRVGPIRVSSSDDLEDSASPITQVGSRKPDSRSSSSAKEPKLTNATGGDDGFGDDGGAAADDATPPTSGAGTTSSSASVGTSGGVPDFVKKLFRMLEDTSESDIVGWGVHGDTFVVREPNEFAKTVLPKHFKHNNPASFVRQLNKYGFHKIRAQHEDGKLYGDSAWEFQHPNFQLNKKEMLESIRRKTTSKGKSAAAAAAPGAPTPAPVSEDKLTTILRKDTTDLQSQVDNLTRLQADIAGYLEGLSRNYRMVVEEVLNFRKNMAAQDQVIRSLVNYIAVKQTGDGFPDYKSIPGASRQELPSSVADDTEQSAAFAFPKNSNLPTSSAAVPFSQGGFPPGFNLDDLGRPAVDLPKDESQRIYSNYENVARASVHQMNEISRHVRQAYSLMQNVPSGLASGSPSSGAEGAAASAGGPSTALGNGSGFSQPGGMSASGSSSLPTSCVPSQMGGFPVGASQQGGLTVFTVGGFTPRRDDVASESGQGRSSPARPPNSMRVTRATCVPPWSVPPKVLLVEDDITCRKLSSKLLQVVGCAFDVAVDGLDAVERMGVGTKYDIVLMDIVMPNLDGVTATNRIRQFDQFTPIISMTSNTTENDCINYLANGMNDILAKPFNKHSMLNMIERYCNHLVGQRAAALGIPMAIAPAGRRWEGLPSTSSGNSGRISEIDMDETSPARAGENASQQMSLSSPLRKGKEPAVSLPTSTMSMADAVAATTALVGEMARDGGMSTDCFSDVLNMSLNEMTGLGILPFGNMVPEGGYMSALGLDQYDARGAGSSSASSLQPQQPQQPPHQQQRPQQRQQQQQQAFAPYTSYTDTPSQQQQQQQQQQHIYSQGPGSGGGGGGGGGSASGGGGGGNSLLSVARLRKRSRDADGTISEAPTSAGGLDTSSSSSSPADSAESAAAADHLNRHHAGNPADAANPSAMYISTTAAPGSKKPKTNHL
ncbi:kinase-regulated stress-responsive transcription factor skn7 [Geranomyces variabilis]|nr:kinase-regulated stress-responsive transcription factor skn7 [Geranomyces variabilis]